MNAARAPVSPFPPEEHAARLARLQAAMAAAEIDALLLTTAPDIFYVTGFLTRFWESPARPWFVVVPASGRPKAVIPAIGVALMARTWIEDIRSWPAPDPDDDGTDLLAEAIAEDVPPAGRLGVPMGLETELRMPLAAFFALQEKIAPRRIVDATAPLQRVREVKSALEIERIRAACAVADRAFARLPGAIGPSMGLDTVFRRFQALLLEEGADWVSYLAGAAGPGGYGDVISPADARPLSQGDVLMLDTGAVLAGHFCDFDRNFSIGPAAPEIRAAHAALVEATHETAAAMRPGMEAREVHALIASALRRAGQTPAEGRLGHGLGLSLTEWPSFSPRDRTILRENMVLTLEPAVECAPGRILVHEEDIVLGPAGARFLSTPAPAEITEIV